MTATTSSRCSTACTTWATRSAPPGTSASARPRRHVDDRRADGRRPRRGQPEPGRPRVLRVLDAALHARVAVPGGRAGARRPGRRGADPRRRHEPAASRASGARPRPRSTSSSRRGRECTTIDRRRAAEQTRARYRTATGFVERDGVRVFSRSTAAASRPSCCCPTWSIVHSRAWKMQIPYLARHFRVVTFDGRGQRPVRPAARSRRRTPRRVRRRRARRPGRDRHRRAVVVGLSMGAPARR